MTARFFFLPRHTYRRAFCFEHQEYWTRLHIWPFAFLLPRVPSPSDSRTNNE